NRSLSFMGSSSRVRRQDRESQRALSPQGLQKSTLQNGLRRLATKGRDWTFRVRRRDGHGPSPACRRTVEAPAASMQWPGRGVSGRQRRRTPADRTPTVLVSGTCRPPPFPRGRRILGRRTATAVGAARQEYAMSKGLNQKKEQKKKPAKTM